MRNWWDKFSSTSIKLSQYWFEIWEAFRLSSINNRDNYRSKQIKHRLKKDLINYLIIKMNNSSHEKIFRRSYTSHVTRKITMLAFTIKIKSLSSLSKHLLRKNINHMTISKMNQMKINQLLLDVSSSMTSYSLWQQTDNNFLLKKSHRFYSDRKKSWSLKQKTIIFSNCQSTFLIKFKTTMTITRITTFNQMLRLKK